MAFVVLVALLGSGFYAYRSFTSCSAETEAALTEFPPYAALEEGPGPNPAAFPEWCGARITTNEEADEVLAYYQEKLTAAGWQVFPERTEANESMIYRSLRAERGQLCYSVGVEHDFQSSGNTIYVNVDRAKACP